MLMILKYGGRAAGIFGYSHFTGGFAGGQAEYVRVPYGGVNLLKLPDSFPDVKSLYLSDVVATSWNCVVDTGVEKGDVVAIWGADYVKSKIPKVETLDFSSLTKSETVTSKLMEMVPRGPDVALELEDGFSLTDLKGGWGRFRPKNGYFIVVAPWTRPDFRDNFLNNHEEFMSKSPVKMAGLCPKCQNIEVFYRPDYSRGDKPVVARQYDSLSDLRVTGKSCRFCNLILQSAQDNYEDGISDVLKKGENAEEITRIMCKCNQGISNIEMQYSFRRELQTTHFPLGGDLYSAGLPPSTSRISKSRPRPFEWRQISLRNLEESDALDATLECDGKGLIEAKGTVKFDDFAEMERVVKGQLWCLVVLRHSGLVIASAGKPGYFRRVGRYRFPKTTVEEESDSDDEPEEEAAEDSDESETNVQSVVREKTFFLV
ncbi:hypothetical protein G7Y89_g8225 [Cudoniella acicularis]|uniref:Uncharacterized protein n=1 Tax=Cudoniella acicularis TaxID=354080 RepID=A0A8H4W3S8_9HELO|nr:hypothetical protein G7Y89_g8225 [Cudoniella acicularis]